MSKLTVIIQLVEELQKAINQERFEKFTAPVELKPIEKKEAPKKRGRPKKVKDEKTIMRCAACDHSFELSGTALDAQCPKCGSGGVFKSKL